MTSFFFLCSHAFPFIFCRVTFYSLLFIFSVFFLLISHTHTCISTTFTQHEMFSLKFRFHLISRANKLVALISFKSDLICFLLTLTMQFEFRFTKLRISQIKAKNIFYKILFTFYFNILSQHPNFQFCNCNGEKYNFGCIPNLFQTFLYFLMYFSEFCQFYQISQLTLKPFYHFIIFILLLNSLRSEFVPFSTSLFFSLRSKTNDTLPSYNKCLSLFDYAH